MLPRTLTNSIGTDDESSTKAFNKALQNANVVSTLKDIFSVELRTEINELQELVKDNQTKIMYLEK